MAPGHLSRDATPETEEESRQPTFDINDALNESGFAEFLAKYPDADALDLTDTSSREIESRYEAFKIKDETVQEMKRLYQDTIYRDTEVKLEDKDLTAVETYVEQQAVEDPESIRRLLERVREFRDLPKRIADKEKQLEQLLQQKQGMDTLLEKEEKLTRVQETNGFLGWLRRTADDSRLRLEVLVKYGGKSEQIAAELERVKASIKQERDVDKAISDAQIASWYMEQNFIRTRREFLNHEVLPLRAITQRAREKAQQRLRELADPTRGLESLELAQAYREKLSSHTTVYRASIFFPEESKVTFSYLEGLDAGEFQEELDRNIESQLAVEMTAAVQKFSLKDRSPLVGLKKSLEKFLAKEQLGSHRSKAARSLLRTVLESAVSNPNIDMPKRLLLKRVCAQFGSVSA